jgi:hypothetical protein
MGIRKKSTWINSWGHSNVLGNDWMTFDFLNKLLKNILFSFFGYEQFSYSEIILADLIINRIAMCLNHCIFRSWNQLFIQLSHSMASKDNRWTSSSWIYCSNAEMAFNKFFFNFENSNLIFWKSNFCVNLDDFLINLLNGFFKKPPYDENVFKTCPLYVDFNYKFIKSLHYSISLHFGPINLFLNNKKHYLLKLIYFSTYLMCFSWQTIHSQRRERLVLE